MKVPIGAKGGMILLSTDVSATGGKRFRDRVAAKFLSLWLRFFKDKLIDRIILEQLGKFEIAVGWSISPIYRGRYYDPEQKVLYRERSFFVEVLDVPYPILKAIAENLRLAFKQREVILKNYDTGESEHIKEAPIPSFLSSG